MNTKPIFPDSDVDRILKQFAVIRTQLDFAKMPYVESFKLTPANHLNLYDCQCAAFILKQIARIERIRNIIRQIETETAQKCSIFLCDKSQ